MHVCHINLSKDFRGGERQTLTLIEALQDRVTQTLVLRRGGRFHKTLTAEGNLPVGFRVKPVASSAIAAFIAAAGVDIIHAQDGRSVQVGAAHSLFGTPFVITRRIQEPPRDRINTRWCYSRAASVVAISRAVASSLTGYCDPAVVDLVHDCAPRLGDPDPAHVREIRRRLGGRFIVAQVAAIDDEKKGQRVLLAAARQVTRTRDDIAFVFIGDGKDLDALRASASDLPNVTFVGRTDRMPDYYAAMDVLAFPSRSEGLGSSMLEAMAFGVPVIASNTGGIPDIVHPDVNGLLFESGDADALARLVLRLVSDDTFRHALGSKAREYAAGFSPEVMAAQYLKIYQRLMRA